MKPFSFVHLLVLAVFMVSLTPASSAATGAAQNSIHLNVLSSDDRETVLELLVDGFEVETFEQGGHIYQKIVIEQTVQSASPGEPQLPVYSTLIGLAGTENVSLQVIDQESQPYQGYSLPPAEEIHVTGNNLLDQGAEIQIITRPGNEGASIDAYFPEQPAQISQSGYLRDQAFAQVTFYPVQYNAARQEFILNRRIVVKVTTNSANSVADDESRGYRPEFEAVLENSLANYADLARPAAGAAEAAFSLESNESQSTAAANPALKITTTQEGMYQLTYNQMVAAGFNPAGIASSTLKLTNRGVEVAILVQDGGDGKIDKTGDRILFFGTAINDVYTNKNVYWLTYSTESGKRMSVQDGTPIAAPLAVRFKNRLHAEQDTEYWQFLPNGEGQDHWFWGLQLSPNTAGYETSRTYSVGLSNIYNTTESANIRFVLKGRSDDIYKNPDHHTKVYVNNHEIKDLYWNGFDILDVNQNFPQSYLLEGNNTVKFETVAVPGVLVDQIFVNWFEITYWDTYKAENNRLFFHAPSDGKYIFQIRNFTDTSIQVFDITDPVNVSIFNNIKLLSDGVEFQDAALAADRYLAVSGSTVLAPSSIILDTPSSWKTTSRGADYIVITYDGFYSNVQPLANFRAGQGLRVEVVKVQDLYDEFNHGIFNPKAIRDFLIYAYNNWRPPAPLYVVLVGDATYDYKDNFHTGSVNYVPSQIVETRGLGETPSDNWFVLTAGNDILPDMYIGRLSAQTAAQVDTIVQKIIRYERDEDPSSWSLGALFVADDGDPAFERDSDAFANLIAPWYETKKLYAAHYPPGDLTLDIVNTINSGTMMVNYLGHGGVNQWGLWGEPPANILDNEDVNLLTNTNKHTFVTIESCLNGFFTGRQTAYSLAEAFQRVSTGGAVAVWAPSGLSYANSHALLINKLYRTFFYDGILGLGEATTLAKWNIYDQSSYYGDIVKIYILFGDPATKLGARDIKLTSIYLPHLNKAP